MVKHVLIVSGESSRKDTLGALTRDCGLEPIVCATTDGARERLARKRFAAVLCEDVLPDGSFRDIMTDTKRLAPETPVIVISRRDDWESYAVALSTGASDYLAFPPYRGEVEQALKKLGTSSRVLATAA